ncbi:MAG: hypothetical protein ACO32I_02040 [Candidatus Limnocylindrus sp.]
MSAPVNTGVQGKHADAVLTVVFADADKTTVSASKRVHVEDKMLSDFIGNGAAKLTVSMEIADKDYGRGVSVMASLTLTVDQDDTMIETAFHYARSLLLDEVKQTVPQLGSIYDGLKRK